jgi:hypothetical protein
VISKVAFCDQRWSRRRGPLVGARHLHHQGLRRGCRSSKSRHRMSSDRYASLMRRLVSLSYSRANNAPRVSDWSSDQGDLSDGKGQASMHEGCYQVGQSADGDGGRNDIDHHDYDDDIDDYDHHGRSSDQHGGSDDCSSGTCAAYGSGDCDRCNPGSLQPSDRRGDRERNPAVWRTPRRYSRLWPSRRRLGLCASTHRRFPKRGRPRVDRSRVRADRKSKPRHVRVGRDQRTHPYRQLQLDRPALASRCSAMVLRALDNAMDMRPSEIPSCTPAICLEWLLGSVESR